MGGFTNLNNYITVKAYENHNTIRNKALYTNNWKP